MLTWPDPDTLMEKAMGKSMPYFSMMVKEIRRQLGLSQEAFDQELSVICATINLWEKR